MADDRDFILNQGFDIDFRAAAGICDEAQFSMMSVKPFDRLRRRPKLYALLQRLQYERLWPRPSLRGDAASRPLRTCDPARVMSAHRDKAELLWSV